MKRIKATINQGDVQKIFEATESRSIIHLSKVFDPEITFGFSLQLSDIKRFSEKYPGEFHYHNLKGVRRVTEPMGQRKLEEHELSRKTFTFEGMGRFFPEIAELRRWLCKLFEFSHDSASAMCGGFYSPVGEGVQRHFDDRDVFVFQVRGSKIWTVEANLRFSEIKKPFSAWFEPGFEDAIQTYGLSLDELMREREFGPTKTVFELKAGDLLYVPCGVWHATYASENSFSLSFGLRPRQVSSLSVSK